MRWSALCVTLAAALAGVGCSERLPTSGVEPGSVSRYAAIAVAPLLSDDVRVHYQTGFKPGRNPPVAAGWNTRDKAGRIVAELLGTARTKVTAVDLSGLSPAGGKAQDWARQVWESLRTADRLGDADVLLVLRQNALDVNGYQYAPALDFLAFGVVGLVVGAATAAERYQPSFQLLTTAGLDAALGNRSRCSVGLDARLIDARGGQELARVDAVLGQERLPEGFVAHEWDAMSGNDRRLAETYCIAALRRAISQAANALMPPSR